MTRKKLSFMNVNNENLLSRDELRGIMAGSGGYACMYYVSGSWTGKLDECTTGTSTGGFHGGLPGLGGSGSYSVSEETCCYKAHDPYGMGFTGRRCINGAVARQC